MRTYQELFAKIFQQELFEKQQFEMLFQMKPVGQLSVLEIGAGSGRTLPLYDSRVAELALVEPNPEMRFILESQLKQTGNLNSTIYDAFSSDLPFLNDSFDFVTIPFVGISEMAPLHMTFSEVHRVLKKDGFCYFLAFNPNVSNLKQDLIKARSDILIEDNFISIDTYKCPHLGEHGYEVVVDIRSKENSNQRFIVQQWSPTVEMWQTLLDSMGFEFVRQWGWFGTSEADITHDRFIGFVIRKKSETPKSALERFYDKLSVDYEHICKGEHYKVPTWLRGRLSTSKLPDLPRWLDIGCGSGIVGDLINELGIDVCHLHGLDLSAEMLKECRKKQTYDALGKCDLNQGIFEIKPMAYDVVTAVGVFEFVVDLEITLKSIAFLLKPSGCLFFTLERQEENPLIPSFFKLGEEKVERAQYTKEPIVQLLAACGFELTDMLESEAYLSPSIGKHVNYLMVSAKRTWS